MSGLSDLLQHLNTEDWSSRRIEKEAAKHGHRLSNATASRYLGGKHPTRPSHETLQAFADLFGTDVQKLREAAGLPGGGTPFELGPEFSRLNGPQRDAIRTVARLYLEQNDELASPVVDDGSTALRERVLTYLERHLVTDEHWPDFEIFPVDAREKVLSTYVDHGVSVINSGVGTEDVVLPILVENAADMIRSTMVQVETDELERKDREAHHTSPDTGGHRAWKNARDRAAAAAVDTSPGGTDADANVHLLDSESKNAEPTKDDFGRAAMAGTSDLERLDRDAAERGEESQDSEDWT